MKLVAPTFTEGIHYRRLSVREGQGIYRFETLAPITYGFGSSILPPRTILSFRDAHGQEWLRLTSCTATIAQGYQWNGNSIKKGIRLLGMDLWLGTPDFRATLAASLPHDAFYQFSSLPLFPLSHETADDCYFSICQQNRFALAAIYHEVLVDFSNSAWACPEPGAFAIAL